MLARNKQQQPPDGIETWTNGQPCQNTLREHYQPSACKEADPLRQLAPGNVTQGSGVIRLMNCSAGNDLTFVLNGCLVS